MGEGKFVAAGGEERSKKGVEGKESRARFQMREAMDFDPKTLILHSQKRSRNYLEKYSVRLPSNVQVEWWTDFMVAPYR